MSESTADPDLCSDPLLRTVPTIEGFKVLNGVVLYAKVGQGGMGAVYRGRHVTLDVDLAVKCLKPQLAAESPDFVVRFEREARLAASFDHQNLVSVRDAQHKDGLHWLVMEFVRGESVRERVQRKGPLPEPEALAILFGAASGLAEAHGRGIVHRDIKPDNLLVSTEGRVKVADLGLAKAQPGSGHSLSLQSAVMGTPQYMAPEQWDTPDVGPAADVWALGASLWFVLTGEHGITGQTFAAMARRVQERDFPSFASLKGLRPAVVALLDRCVQRDPAARFPSAKELLAALRPLVVVDEAVLADAAAGSNRARLGDVTPPPRQALLRIRAQLDTASSPRDGAALGAAPTIPSPGATVPMPPPTAAQRGRGRLALTFAGVLVLATGVAHGLGAFDPPTDWSEAEAVIQARRLYEQALQRLPEPNGLDAGIDGLEQVLLLRPEFGEAKRRLAQALEKRAELRLEQDPDAAFVDAQRAASLDAANQAALDRLEQVRNRLAARMHFGMRITSPADGEVVDGPRIVVRGKVTAPGVASVDIALTMADGPDERPTRKVSAPVLAGEFTATVEAFDAGLVMLGLGATDRHGVRGGCLPSRALVPGVVGALGQAPRPEQIPMIVTASGITMLPVLPGAFVMGSDRSALGSDEDETRHQVGIFAPYWLGATEVTRAQWRRVMGDEPWLLLGGDEPADGVDLAALPATGITWTAAVAFCERVTERERLEGRLPRDYVYCLPTEAQWERAALGGGSGPFPHGEDWQLLATVAVFADGEARSRPLGVASRQPNAYGLFDVAGNVDEWCADLADGLTSVTTDTYVDGLVDPWSRRGENLVVRGGNFRSMPKDCRCASRQALPIESARDDLGLRIALAPRRE
jgi:formylglycine-generating enzyme required for sulfatase activity